MDNQTAPPLSQDYQKARKQLMLWSAILFAHQLIGIDVSRLEEAGGSVGAIFSSIQSPGLIPWVLMVLVVYFAFRTIIEFMQCDKIRRTKRITLIDICVSIAFSMMAVLILILQSTSSTRVADAIEHKSFSINFISAVFITQVTIAMLFSPKRQADFRGPIARQQRVWRIILRRIPSILFLMAVGILAFNFYQGNLVFLPHTFVWGIFFALVTVLIIESKDVLEKIGNSINRIINSE